MELYSTAQVAKLLNARGVECNVNQVRLVCSRRQIGQIVGDSRILTDEQIDLVEVAIRSAKVGNPNFVPTKKTKLRVEKSKGSKKVDKKSEK